MVLLNQREKRETIIDKRLVFPKQRTLYALIFCYRRKYLPWAQSELVRVVKDYERRLTLYSCLNFKNVDLDKIAMKKTYAEAVKRPAPATPYALSAFNINQTTVNAFKLRNYSQAGRSYEGYLFH